MLRTFVVTSATKRRGKGEETTGETSRSRSPTLLSQHRVKRHAVSRDTDARHQLVGSVNSTNLSDTLVWLNNSENAQKKFPGKSQNSPQATGEAPESLYLSVRRETTEAKKCSENQELGGVKRRIVRERQAQRVWRRTRRGEERKKSESARKILRFRYVVVFSYFLPS